MKTSGKKRIPLFSNPMEGLDILGMVRSSIDDYSEESLVLFLQLVFDTVKNSPADQSVFGSSNSVNAISDIFNFYVTLSAAVCQECLAVVHILCRCSEHVSTFLESAALQFAEYGCLQSKIDECMLQIHLG